MKRSLTGTRFTSQTGILQLMDDLGKALSGSRKKYMLGGGNPAILPEIAAAWRREMRALLEDESRFDRAVGQYDTPQGRPAFLKAITGMLNREYGWDLTEEHVAVTNGSQSAFFMLFNLLAGPGEDGIDRKILFPLMPEYIGYRDQAIWSQDFRAFLPRIERIDEHRHKYHVDFDALEVDDDVAAICVSRPTNPTGNVLTDGEVARLSALAKEKGIPLIIDNAYGTPFPNIIFTEVRPVWDEQIILCMSLSKLGLPGARTGIVIANPDVIGAVSAFNAISSLAPGGVGAALALELIRSGEIIRLSREVIKPYYQQKAEQAVTQLRGELEGVDFYIHKPEGALFLWLWFRGLPITCQELYDRLKQRGVLVVPGHYFFPGLTEAWRHKQECIRVTYSQEEAVVEAGLRIIAEEVKRAYL